jgi:hypothetical protein
MQLLRMVRTVHHSKDMLGSQYKIKSRMKQSIFLQNQSGAFITREQQNLVLICRPHQVE